MTAVRLLTARAAILERVPAWTSVWDASPEASPVSHPDVVLGLSDALGLPGHPVLLEATSRGKNPIFLPLRRMVEGPGGLGLRTLTAMAGWHLPPSDLVGAAADDPDTLLAVTHCLATAAEWDLLDLNFVPRTTRLASLLPSGASAEAGEQRRVPLGGTASLYTGSGASRMRQYERRLARRGDAEVVTAEPAARVAEVAGAFMDLHTARWVADGAAAEFRDATVRARIVAWMQSLHARGLLVIGSLRLDGTVVAAHVALCGRTERVAWRIAHAPGFEELSLGRLLFAHMIEQARADGMAWYGMGRGTEPYKQSWRAEVTPLLRCRILAKRPATVLRRAVSRGTAVLTGRRAHRAPAPPPEDR